MKWKLYFRCIRLYEYFSMCHLGLIIGNNIFANTLYRSWESMNLVSYLQKHWIKHHVFNPKIHKRNTHLDLFDYSFYALKMSNIIVITSLSWVVCLFLYNLTFLKTKFNWLENPVPSFISTSFSVAFCFQQCPTQ